MQISFQIPAWLIPKHIRDNLDQRAKLTGKASRQWEGSLFKIIKAFFSLRAYRE